MNSNAKDVLCLGENYSIRLSNLVTKTGKPMYELCLCGSVVYTLTIEQLLKIADVGDIIVKCKEIKIRSEIGGVPITANIEAVKAESIDDSSVHEFICFNTPTQTFNIKTSIWEGFSQAVRIFINL